MSFLHNWKYKKAIYSEQHALTGTFNSPKAQEFAFDVTESNTRTKVSFTLTLWKL